MPTYFLYAYSFLFLCISFGLFDLLFHYMTNAAL